MDTFTVHLLGCGSAKPSTRHNPACTVVNHRDTLYMIDCGEGAQKEFQRQRLKFSRLRHIFLTHLHGDHVLGLPGLIGTLGLSGFGGKLTIHTFEEGKRILTPILDYFCGELPFDLEFNIIPAADGIVMETNSLLVRSVELDHRVPAVGYVFEEKPKPRHLRRDMADYHQVPVAKLSQIKAGADFVKPDGTVVPNSILTTAATPSLTYAHISDTAFMPSLPEKIRNADLLFHETTYCNDHAADAAERGHSTAAQAARIAAEANAGRLITGHYSSRYHDEAMFLKEAREKFPRTILGREGLSIKVADRDIIDY